MELVRILILTIVVSISMFGTVVTQYSLKDREYYKADEFVGIWYIVAVGRPIEMKPRAFSCTMWNVIKRENDIFNIVHSNIGEGGKYEGAVWRVKIFYDEIFELKEFHNNYHRNANVLTLNDYEQPNELMVHNDHTREIFLLSRNETVSNHLWNKYKNMLHMKPWRWHSVSQKNCIRYTKRYFSDSFAGKWNVIIVAQPPHKDLSIKKSCMWMNATLITHQLYNIQSSVGNGTQRIEEKWTGWIHDDKIDEIVSGVRNSSRKVISIMDYDDEFDIVLYNQVDQVLWLMSRNRIVGPELWKKYNNIFTKDHWKFYHIDNKNCQ